MRVARSGSAQQVCTKNSWGQDQVGTSAGTLCNLRGASNQHLVFRHSKVAMRRVLVSAVEPPGEIMRTALHHCVLISCLLLSPCAVHFPASCRSTIGM